MSTAGKGPTTKRAVTLAPLDSGLKCLVVLAAYMPLIRPLLRGILMMPLFLHSFCLFILFCFGLIIQKMLVSLPKDYEKIPEQYVYYVIRQIYCGLSE